MAATWHSTPAPCCHCSSTSLYPLSPKPLGADKPTNLEATLSTFGTHLCLPDIFSCFLHLPLDSSHLRLGDLLPPGLQPLQHLGQVGTGGGGMGLQLLPLLETPGRDGLSHAPTSSPCALFLLSRVTRVAQRRASFSRLAPPSSGSSRDTWMRTRWLGRAWVCGLPVLYHPPNLLQGCR